MKRLTSEERECRILEVITPKGYELLCQDGDDKGKNTKYKLRCAKDVCEWSSSYNNTVNAGNGCPRCTGRERYTPESLTEVLNKKIGSKYEFSFDKFAGVDTRINFRCKTDGYEWSASFSNIVNHDSGCRVCSGVLHTPETLTVSLNKKIGSKYEFSFDKFAGAGTRLRLRCKIDGYEWNASFSNIIRGRGCPVCAGYGFRPNKPGDFYINTGLYEGKPFVKYGVTQREGDSRINEQIKSSNSVTDYKQIYRESFDVGFDALLAEKFFDDLKAERLPKEVFPDGWTETITNIPVDEIMRMVYDGKHKTNDIKLEFH